MAITRVRQTNAGTFNKTAVTTWTLTLSGTPTVGNTLLLYIGGINALSITSIVQGGSNSNWTSVYTSTNTNTNVYVYALNVTAGSNTTVTLTLGSANNRFYSICEEISGLVNTSWLDKSTNTISASTNTPTTGTTATTTSSNEYWVNLYFYYSPDGDAQGSSPTNSYTLYNSGTPIKFSDTGWLGGSNGVVPALFSGVMMAYKIVSIVGTAGGGITDSLANLSAYNSVALAFSGTSGDVVATRRRVSSSFL
jgi:hypothetical protein